MITTKITCFSDVLSYLESHEATKALSKTITDWLAGYHRTPDDVTDWLAGYHRTPDDVTDYFIGARNDLPDTEDLTNVRMPVTPIYDLAVTFKDDSETKASFMLWRGIWMHD
jgi:hypothetical protein